VQLVFVVGGENKTVQFARYHLQLASFNVRTVSSEEDVIKHGQRTSPELIVVDATTPEVDDLGLCRRIRANYCFARAPVIILAADASEQQRILGLEAGADDYISGLPSGKEFVVRVRALIRRFARLSEARFVVQPLAFINNDAAQLRGGEIELDTSAMKLVVRGEEIETTTLEFRLMYYLTHNRTRVFSRDQLLDAVWGGLELNPRCVDACVRRLRRKIEPDYTNPTYLKTIRGAGYSLSAA
jgi:DNA-binding response OmpR family regulator